jgi:hypothetical protein
MGQTNKREMTMNTFTKYAVAAAVAAVIGWGYQANAMTVGWGDTASPFLTLGNGVTPLPVGDLIEIGSDSAGTLAGFTPWATGFIGDGTGTEGSFQESTTSLGAGFFSAPIYILAYNSVTAVTATGEALVTNPAWAFPANDQGFGTIDVSDAGLSVVLGTVHTGTITDTNLGAGSNALAVTVPEPSSIALVVMGLLGGFGLIRRRRS